MKRFFIALLLIIVSITGCSLFNNENNQNNNHEKVVENKSIKETKNSKEENVKNKNTGQQKNPSSDKESLKNYRANLGVKKVFIDHEGVESLTEEVVYENGDYVQSIVKIGQSASVIIYKWTDDEIAIAKTIKNPNDPFKNYLTGFKEDSNLEVMLTRDQSTKSSWRIIKKNATVQTPYKSFNNVYVIEKITNEVEGADTIYTNYLAPRIGTVKETFKVTGDQGYSAESLLKKVEE